MSKPPLKNTYGTPSQLGSLNRKKLQEDIAKTLAEEAPPNLNALNSQNKKLRGYLKVYNNFLTALIKKSSKFELLSDGGAKSEFKNRSVEVQI